MLTKKQKLELIQSFEKPLSFYRKLVPQLYNYYTTKIPFYCVTHPFLKIFLATFTQQNSKHFLK